MRTRTAVARSFLPLLCLCCLAQQSSSPDQGNAVPTFQSATHIVVLDVVVTDKQGHPVRNLTKDDFTILEDGQPQTIASFEPPSQHAPAPIEENVQAASLNGSPENQVNTGRGSSALTVIVLDELDTMVLDQAYARAEIRKFLRAHSPRLPEPTALMALEERKLELLHDYTSDAKAIETALDNHPARLPFRLMNGGGPIGASMRLADALEALREIAAANGQFAARKNVIWIGSGFPSLNYLITQPTVRRQLMGYVRETSDLIWQGRVAVYTLDPRGLEVVHENIGGSIGGSFLAPPDTPTGQLMFEQLAPQTGGRIFRGLNDLDVQIATSIEDGDSFYAMSYYPSNHNWNGKFRIIKIAMRDPDLIARTRNGYYAAVSSTPSALEMERLLSRAVINPLSYHSLSVQAHATLSGSPQRTAHISTSIDAKKLQWDTPEPGKRRCEITIVAAGFSSAAKVVAYSAKEFEIVVDDEKYSRLLSDGMVMNLAMALPSTAVRMRVVARDSTNGNMGTADLTPEGQQFH